MLDTVSDHQDISATALWAGLTVRLRSEDPVLLEITDDYSEPDVTLNGTTSFFRQNDSEIFETAEKIMQRTGQDKVDITIIGGSVGAQAYSMAYVAQQRDIRVSINTLDLSSRFTAIAQAGIYPEIMGVVETQYDLGFLEQDAPGYVRVKDKFRKNVNVLPSQSATCLSPDVGGDIIVMTNILGYLSPKAQSKALKMAAERSRHAVAFIGGTISDLPYHLHKAGLVPAHSRFFDIDTLCENFRTGCSTMAFKCNY